MKRMHDFEVGDRVIHSFKSDHYGYATIIFLKEKDGVWLDFDRPGASASPHDCNGLAKPGCGYKASAKYLTLVPYNWKKL